MCVYIQITKQLFNITEVVGVFVFLKTEFWYDFRNSFTDEF